MKERKTKRNTSGLVQNTKRTPCERRKSAKNAGVASGAARRKKKLLREYLDEVLFGEISAARKKRFEELAVPVGTLVDDIHAALFSRALTGDPRAYEVIRDTLGQKPTDRVEVTAQPTDKWTEEEVYERLRRIVPPESGGAKDGKR